jgi:branched-chain amino acid transport system permease protein
VADYLAAILIFGGVYALLGIGLNLQWGHTGLLNLGLVAFFAVGAYTSALLTLHGVPVILGPVVGLVLAGLAAYPIGRLSLRLEDDYLAIVSFGFAQVVQVFLINTSWTGGNNGLTGIRQFFPVAGVTVRPYLYLALVLILVLLALVMSHRLTESPYGRLLRAIRDSIEAVGNLGKNANDYRLAALVLGSALAGLAGGIYAHYIGYISPDQFDSTLSFLVFTGIVIGGSSHWGAAVGTLLFVSVMEATRFLRDVEVLPVTDSQFAQIRLMVVGIVLVLVMQRRPRGLWPYRHRSRRARSDHAEG